MYAAHYYINECVLLAVYFITCCASGKLTFRNDGCERETEIASKRERSPGRETVVKSKIVHCTCECVARTIESKYLVAYRLCMIQNRTMWMYARWLRFALDRTIIWQKVSLFADLSMTELWFSSAFNVLYSWQQIVIVDTVNKGKMKRHPIHRHSSNEIVYFLAHSMFCQ